MALKNARTTLKGLQDQEREAVSWINAAKRYVIAIDGAGDGKVAFALTSKFVDFARILTLRIWFDCGYGDKPRIGELQKR